MAALHSAIVCNYNHGEFIADAVASVLANLDPALEVVVVDDGSTDESRERLEVFRSDARVKLVFQENQGQPGAFSTGVAQAQGDVLYLFDGDDFWFPHKARTIRQTIATHELGDGPWLLRHPLLKLFESEQVVQPRETYTADTPSGLRSLKLGDFAQTLEPDSARRFVQETGFALYGGGNFGGSTVMSRAMADVVFPLPRISKYYGDSMPLFAAPLIGPTYILARNLGIYRYHGGNHSIARKREPLEFYLGLESYINSVCEANGLEVSARFLDSMLARPYLLNDRQYARAIRNARREWRRTGNWKEWVRTCLLAGYVQVRGGY